MRNCIARAFLGTVALFLAAVVSAQEPQNKTPSGDDQKKSEERMQEMRSIIEQRMKQIQEETKKRMEQFEEHRKKIEAQAKAQMEQVDVEAKKMAEQARMQMENLMKKFKEAAGEKSAPDKASAVSPPRSLEEKLDKILDRLDKLEHRLDRLEKGGNKRASDSSSK
jgi:hypothetical protein